MVHCLARFLVVSSAIFMLTVFFLSPAKEIVVSDTSLLGSTEQKQLDTVQRTPLAATTIVTAPVLDTSIDARFSGLLSHVRWLIASSNSGGNNSEIDRINRQIFSFMDDVSDDFRDVRDDIDDVSVSLSVTENIALGSYYLSGDGDNEGLLVDSTGGVQFTAALLDTFGNSGTSGDVLLSTGTSTTWVATSSLGISSLSNNAVIPDYVLSTGKNDEYCLTYEATGDTWEYQSCASGSVTTADLDTSAELAAILTDETGSGALVFASSPSLTTPTISGGSLSGTFTTTAAITIGDNGDNIIIDASNWDVSSGGVISGATWQGNIISSNYLDSGVILGSEIDTSAELLALLTDETGTGNAVFSSSPTFSGTVVFGNTGIQIGTSIPFSDAAGTLTLQNIDVLDATTESTIESAIDTLSNLTSVSTITSGTWQGTAIGDAYLTKTGAWTGTFDGQEGTYYVDLANSTGDSDDVTEGSTNLFFTNTRARTAISNSITGITYTSGTGVFSQTAGYTIPLTASTTDWSTAYGWGDHSAAGYLSSTAGNWTGTFDGQEGSYYLANSFATSSADYWETQQTARTADDLSDNSTSDLAEGTNLYWTNSRFDSRLAATTSLSALTTLNNLSSVGTITSGTWQGTAIGDAYLTKTGNWTGTFDGQEGTFYLDLANATGDTDDLTEGTTNLFFTNTRARTAISNSITGITYTSGTGVFSQTAGYTIPLTASTTDWSTAYGWGDHSAAGYLTGNQTITLSGDITGSGATSITTAIAANSIIEPDLNADVAAVDGDFLQYDSTGTNFTWRSASEVLSDIGAGDFFANGSVAMTDTLQLASGDLGTGGISFSADPDTGIYRSAADTLTIKAGGSAMATITDTLISFGVGAGVFPSFGTFYGTTFQAGLLASTTAAAPGFALDSDSNSGMFGPADNVIGFSTNATERMRIDASGNVGIGTTTPAYLLDVNGTMSVGSIYMGGNVGDFTIPTGSLNILTTTNIAGISLQASGVTSAAVMNLSAPLSTDTGNGKVFQIYAAGEGYGRAMFYSDGKFGIGGGTAVRDIFISRQATSTLKISSDGSSGLGNLIVTGNVGIGTTSPYAKLSVTGDLALTGGIYDNSASRGTNGMVLQTTGTGVNWVATSSLGIGGAAGDFYADGSVNMTDTLFLAAGALGTGGISFAGDTNLGINRTTTDVLAVQTNGVESMYFSEFNVGFYSDKVEIDNTGQIRSADALTASSPSYSFITDTDTGIYNAAANVLGLSVGGSGVASVSSSNFTASGLAFSGFSFAASTVFTGGNGSAGAPTYSFSTDPNTGMYRSAADELSFSTNGTQRLRIQSNGTVTATGDIESGSVLIDSMGSIYLDSYARIDADYSYISVGNFSLGTTSTPHQLTVAGDAYITGALVDNASSTGSAGMVLQSTGTGFNWVATSSLGFTAGGDFYANGSVNMTDTLFLAQGALGTGGISFAGDTDTGIERSVANNLDFYAGGSLSQYISSTEVGFFGGTAVITTDTVTTNKFNANFAALSSAAAPGFNFGTGLGMFSAATNKLGFSTNSTERMTIDATGNVGIGTTTPSDTLTINGTQYLYNDNLTLPAPGASGNSYFSKKELTLSPSVDYTVAAGGYQFVYGDQITQTTTNDTVATDLTRLYQTVRQTNLTYLADAPTTQLIVNSNSLLASSTELIGATTINSSSLRHRGSGTITTAAVFTGSISNSSTGTITNGYGQRLAIYNQNAAANITTAYGLSVDNLVNTGTIGSLYGVYVGDLTAGTQTNTPFSFYASDAGTYNYFAGNVGIGTTSPYAKLSVTGDLALTGGIYDNSASLGTSGMVLQTTGTGFNWVATSSLGFTAGGDFFANGTVDMTDTLFLSQGALGTGGISFVGDSDTGIYRAGGDDVTISTGGVQHNFTPSQVYLMDATIGFDSAGVVSAQRYNGNYTGASSASSPAFSFGNNSGMFSATANVLGFSTNSVERMTIDATGNVGIGTTPSYKLDVAGFINTDIYSGYRQGGNLLAYASSTSGTAIFGIGAGGPAATTSAALPITAFGNKALFSYSGTGGTGGPTAVGYESLKSLTNGTWATGLGHQAGTSMTSGSITAIGYKALSTYTSSGSDFGSVAVGANALQKTTNGYQNVAVGSGALTQNTTGSNNVAFGQQAGSYIADGSTANALSNSSVYIGNVTKSLASGNTNQIVIGYDATGNGSNSATLGNTSITKTILQGSVGIGTASPNYKLDIQASTAQLNLLSTTTGNYAAIRVGNGISPIVMGIESSSGASFTSDGSPYAAIFGSDGFTDTQLITGGNVRLTIDATSGNVGIGTTTPAQKLQVFGDIRVGTSGSNGCLEDYGGTLIAGTCSSDERLKTDITPVAGESTESFMERLAQLDVVTYKWNQTASTLYSKNIDIENIGLIAQNVESVFPELISYDDEGYRQVDFRAFPFYLIEAMKELWAKVTDHDERLQDLENENERLQNRLKAIESELNVDVSPPVSDPDPEPAPEVTDEEIPVQEEAPPEEAEEVLPVQEEAHPEEVVTEDPAPTPAPE